MRARAKGVLIAGGGVAGSLAAIALARLRPEVPVTIVEERGQLGGDRFHFLFDEEMSDSERALAAMIPGQGWPGFYLAFPDRTRNLKAALIGFAPEAVHQCVVHALPPERVRLGRRILALRDDALELEGGETLRAEGVIDARGAANLSMLDLLHAHRLERQVRLGAPHRLDRPMLVDAHVDQDQGLLFHEIFPIGPHRLHIARILISERMRVDEASTGLDLYMERRGWKLEEVEEESESTTNLPLGGNFDSFWRIGGARVARLGQRGGFVQPATGRTVPDAVRNARLLAEQSDFSGSSLHDLFEDQAKAQWKKRDVQRQFLQALAATPLAERRQVAESLYLMERSTLLNFLGDRLGLLERRQVQRALKR